MSLEGKVKSEINEMTNHFIFKGKNYTGNTPNETLKNLRKENGKDAKIMTFAEAIKKYNQTKVKEYATTDDIYFRIQTKEGKKIVHLAGTGLAMPKTKKAALKIYNDLKQKKYNNQDIETIVGDELNTKNATKHMFASIIDDDIEKAGWDYASDWMYNAFVKLINGGRSGLKEIAQGYKYDELGSFYDFVEVEPGFEKGYVVNIKTDECILHSGNFKSKVQFRAYN